MLGVRGPQEDFHGQDEAHPGADYRQTQRGYDFAGARQQRAADRQATRRHGADVLPLAQEIRRHAGEPGLTLK